MPSIAILNSHPVSVLRKEISKTNIKGYSKMKKDEIVSLMMSPENKDKFHHIEMAVKKVRESKKAPEPEPKKEKLGVRVRARAAAAKAAAAKAAAAKAAAPEPSIYNANELLLLGSKIQTKGMSDKEIKKELDKLDKKEKKEKKPRSAKQLANDKKLGEAATARASAKK